MIGMEADVSLVSPVDTTKHAPGAFDTAIDYVGTVRGRIGYAFGVLMPYATGGLAWGQTKVNVFADDGSALFSKQRTHLGWTAGAGVEMAVGGNWSAKLEYDYINLAGRSFDLRDVSLPNVHVDPSMHLVKAGLNYRLWNTPSWSSSRPSVKTEIMPESADWNIHGQTTFIGQGYPRIRSPYQGANSLPAGGQARETLTAAAFLGWRLWDGGEFYFNPELAQGFGLNGTLGLAGFPNGEAQKGGAEYPKFRAQRYFLRQTFGLGGEQEEVADAALQLAGKRDINRVTLTIGRFAVGDFFDGNS